MTKKEWNEGLNLLDSDLVEKYVEQKEKIKQKKKSKRVWTRLGTVAACLVLVGGVIAGVYVLREDESAKKSSDDTDQIFTYVHSDSFHMGTQAQEMKLSYEECLSAATHVVSAAYKGEYEIHGIYKDLVFTVTDRYKGTDISDEFHLRVDKDTNSVAEDGIGYSATANGYKVGENYLLVLEKHVSVYNPYDLYLALGNIEKTNDTTVAYVKNYVKDSVPPAAQGFEFIRNSNLENVVDNTSIIAVVTSTEYIGGSENNDTSRYLCTVNEVLKGSIKDTDINVIFVTGSVEPDGEYVVMMEEMGPYYILSSKNSVHDADDSNIIQQVKDMVSVEAVEPPEILNLASFEKIAELKSMLEEEDDVVIDYLDSNNYSMNGLASKSDIAAFFDHVSDLTMFHMDPSSGYNLTSILYYPELDYDFFMSIYSNGSERIMFRCFVDTSDGVYVPEADAVNTLGIGDKMVALYELEDEGAYALVGRTETANSLITIMISDDDEESIRNTIEGNIVPATFLELVEEYSPEVD